MATFMIKQEESERRKVKKKMSKAQMQLAIIKKKQCDATALTIVEQLLEPKIDSQWLLYNLRYINKSHMEDVIEERSIIKLCGYVLCANALTIVIEQKYHISTRKNKVYDVTRRKNFCSSLCYGACNYLLEQMLTSPLWLRDKEEIPEFKLLPAKDELERCTPGDEICMNDTLITSNLDKKEKPVELNEMGKDSKDKLFDKYFKYSIKTLDTIEEQLSKISNKDAEYVKNESINLKDMTNNAEEYINNDTIKEISTLDNNISLNENRNWNKTNNEEQTRLFEVLKTEHDITIVKPDNDINSSYLVQEIEKTKCKIHKQKRSIKNKQSSEFYNFIMHIESNVREWITKDTLCLLSGKESIKQQLLDNITQHDRYLHLCKKLNKLQLEDEKDDCTDLIKNTLKPLPQLSVLQEEGKKIELKVRAFYKGDLVIEAPKKITEDAEQSNEFTAVLPLTDAQTPGALRRRIFLDKLHRILPDLVRALTADSGLSQYIYNCERSALIKALVNTFSLSATNIIFKTAEWTLVGLIIIKMLGMIDLQLKVLLSSKQASMYISMILMSYKLDSNYLDRIVMELTNNTIVNTDDTANF
ncbi:putative RNA polymerase II subunit B1 CTD phosphatase RPAP2 isoform X1 [Ptiloglossa arizonensis]|uniref:putative RNA polymerase II subunit B1 CTD phosphatase RPAP2 isoform X1 n=2 Tax=Ptiloglossa arizonensis TaxID=3350558 RepID=UPI003FA05C2C